MSIIIGTPMTCLPTAELAQLRADLATAKQDLVNEQASHGRTHKMLHERLATVTAERATLLNERELAHPKAPEMLVNVGASTGPYWVRLDRLQELLATQGLAIVSAESAEAQLAAAKLLLWTVRSRLVNSHPESASDIDEYLRSHATVAHMVITENDAKLNESMAEALRD